MYIIYIYYYKQSINIIIANICLADLIAFLGDLDLVSDALVNLEFLYKYKMITLIKALANCIIILILLLCSCLCFIKFSVFV